MADEFDVKVDPLGNTLITGKHVSTIETENSIIELKQVGSFWHFADGSEVIGPGISTISITNLDED